MLRAEHPDDQPVGHVKLVGPTMLGAAVRCYSRNTNALAMVSMLLDLLTPAAAHNVVARTDGNGSTGLMDACRVTPQSTSLVQTLLSIGASTTINKSDAAGTTALMIASQRAFTPAVQLLLEHGADVDQVDTVGHTALWHACDAVSYTHLTLPTICSV
eukprot:3058550-Prymnesium_polylepis.2